MHQFRLCSAPDPVGEPTGRRVSAKCYFQLRQLRRVRRSLDEESVATLVHAFYTSRIDYCNGLLAGAPKAVTDKLQRVMNSAARIDSNTRKFNHGLTHV